MKNKIFHNITICCWEKTFSFTLDEAKVEDLAKASVAENNLLCYWEN